MKRFFLYMFACTFVFSLVLISTLKVSAAPTQASQSENTITRFDAARLELWTQTQTKTIPGSKAICNQIIKQYPRLASNKQGCIITLTSVTAWAPNDTAEINASTVSPFGSLSCPTGTTNHTATENGELGLWSSSMTTTFSYPGNCGLPKITYHVCNISSYTYAPYTGINVNGCDSSVQGTTQISANQRFIVTAVLGINTSGTIQTIASYNTNQVSDNLF